MHMIGHDVDVGFQEMMVLMNGKKYLEKATVCRPYNRSTDLAGLHRLLDSVERG